MLIQESRTYKLAKAALLAVLLVVTPLTGYLHQVVPSKSRINRKTRTTTTLYVTEMYWYEK